MTKKVALIGHPISHSLSPKLHNYWIKQYGIDAEYEAIDVLPEDLESTVKRMRDEGYVGCNVTHPHKRKMFKISLPFIYVMGIRHVNTVVFNKYEGLNDLYFCETDTESILKSIGSISNKKVLIIGDGSVGISTAMKLFENNNNIHITSRNDRVEVAKLQPYINYIYWNQKQRHLSDIDLLINATPCGMAGYPELDINLSTLNKNAVVFDAIYSPKETGLLKQARELGHKTINGFDMFLYQAQASFKIWFGIKPKITQELRDYLMEGIK